MKKRQFGDYIQDILDSINAMEDRNPAYSGNQDPDSKGI